MKFTRFRSGGGLTAPFAAGSLIFITCSALAQSEPTPDPPSPTVPRPPQAPPQPGAPKPVPQAGETLSERLDRTDGVLTPPPVGDPDIVQPPPDNNAKIKVIPPPPASGGDAEPGK